MPPPRTADGLMPCHLARPVSGEPYPAVIVVMEAFGLNGHIKAVAERVAREGYVTLAPDLYHRFGSPIVPYQDIPKAIDYLKKLDDAKVMAEIGGGVAHLKTLRDVRADRVGIMGFCMGGRVAFLAAATHPAALQAAVAFYGGGIAVDAPNAPVNAADRITAPVLALFGATDQMIPLDQVKRLDETMRRLGKTYESKVYAGTRVRGGRARLLLRQARLLRQGSGDGCLEQDEGLVFQALELTSGLSIRSFP